MNILVTGASGFIGSFMVEEALRRGLQTWAGVRSSSSRLYLHDPRINVAMLDFDHLDKLEKELLRHKEEHNGWDYIIHCAGATKCRHTIDFDRINYDATRCFVDLLRKLNMVPHQFIYISSLSVYGPIHELDYVPITENDKPVPNTAYGISKLKAERYIQNIDNFPYVIFRPTGVYGPRERDYFMMAESIKNHLDVAVGFRRQDLTFVYVKDLVKAIYLSIDKGVVRRNYFVSDSKVYSSRAFSDYIRIELGTKILIRITFPLFMLKIISVIAEIISGWMGKSSTLNSDKYKIMKQRNWQCDITPLVKELGFKPDYDLKSGVKETIAWYKKEGWL